MKKLLLAAFVAALVAAPVAAAPPSLTLKAAPGTVPYGGSATVSGVLSTQKAGAQIDVLAEPCGQNAFKKLTTAPTATGGTFSATVKPTMNTTYQAKEKSASSQNAAVTVAPLVGLKKLAAGTTRKFVVTLTAAQSFVGKYVVVQRKSATKWRTIKSVTFGAVKQTTAPTQVSSQRFSLRLKGHPQLRAILTAIESGTCYEPAKSPAIRS